MSTPLPRHDDVELPLTDDVECRRACLPLVQRVRPEWHDGPLTFKFFTNGITNKIFSLYPSSTDGRDRLVFRVYGAGTDLIIDRFVDVSLAQHVASDAELRNWRRLAERGQAAPLHGVFANGIVCGYQPGDVLDIETVRSDRLYPKIASTMAAMHRIVQPHETTPNLWTRLAVFMSNIPKEWSDEKRRARIPSEFFTHDELLAEVAAMKTVVDTLDTSVAFCHNDLLMNNILYDDVNDDIRFIDYEYAAPNYRAYDIANHFNEYAGIDNIDFARHPDAAFQRRWLREYVRAWNGSADDAALDALHKAVVVFTPISHFFWAVWAMVQAVNSTIDFDYFEYGLDRMGEYKKKRGDIRM